MKATSTYVNCTNLTSTEIQAKIKAAQVRLQTLNYIISNKNYTKAHRYDAIVETMVLEGQIVYLQFQLQQKLQQENNPVLAQAPKPAFSNVSKSAAPLRSRAKMHGDYPGGSIYGHGGDLAIRHRLMTPKEKELLQRNKNMYAFLDEYTLN